MSDEMEGQPAASCVIEGSAFDVEAQTSREIEWHAPRWPRELSPPWWKRSLPQFYSVTAASRIPIEIWDKIFRYLRHERETLGITEEVCRGWYSISHRLKSSHVGTRCSSMEDVRLYVRYIKTIPRQRRSETRVFLLGSAAEQGKQRSRAGSQRSDNEAEEDSAEGKHRRAGKGSLAHLGTFAAMFAGGLLPLLSSLIIGSGEWTPGIPQRVFLHLSSFHSITSLGLLGITLPSITVLFRLVCAFNRLQELEIRHLRLLDRRVPPASRRWAPSAGLKKLTFTDLNWPDELCALSAIAKLETSGGSETVLFLSNALSCSDLQELLHHAGKTLRQVEINPFKLPSGANVHIVQPLRVQDVDLSQNVGLRELSISTRSTIPAAFLERAETYGVIQWIISSTCPTVLENINIHVWPTPSAASTSIMSHVLDALRTALCPPDHSLEPEKYTSLNSVELWFMDADESSKRQIEAIWANLAPIWFPSLYSRGIMSLNFPPVGLPYDDSIVTSLHRFMTTNPSRSIHTVRLKHPDVQLRTTTFTHTQTWHSSIYRDGK